MVSRQRARDWRGRDEVATDAPEVAQQLLIDEFELGAQAAFDFAGGDRILFSRIRRGKLRLTRERGADVVVGAGDVAVTGAPGISRGSEADDVQAQILTLERSALAAVAAPDPGIEPQAVEIRDLRPLSAEHARVWDQTLEAVSKLFEDADTRRARLIAGRSGRLLAAVTLSTFRNDAPAAPRGYGAQDARPDTLRLAIAFIESDPQRDIAIADVSRAAHVTVRSVQQAFRRHLDTTPMAYLRKVRLDHSHRQLLAADPGDGTTVGRVALDWGFANPSRFARYYRDAYGRTPSTTLAE